MQVKTSYYRNGIYRDTGRYITALFTSWAADVQFSVQTEIFLFCIKSRLPLGPLSLLSNIRLSSFGIKRPEHEAGHSLHCASPVRLNAMVFIHSGNISFYDLQVSVGNKLHEHLAGVRNEACVL